VDEEACYKGEGEGDGIMTRMSAAVATALSIGRVPECEGGGWPCALLSALPFASPQPPPRDIYISLITPSLHSG
jgi:hypothetical protein